jgi:hypothetical protein
MVKENPSIYALFLIVALVCISPAAAGSIAVYGSTAGFIPELHADRFSVAYAIPVQSGQLLDENVANVTNASIQVIFIGGDDTFAAATAGEIEQAVWDGKILVVSYPATGKFGDSLPFSGSGVVPGADYLEVASPGNKISQAVFTGLASRFNATTPVTQRLAASSKAGTSTVLKYSTGEPALAYRKYGSGYVIGWTLESPSSYLGNDDADTVIYRLITALLDAQQGTMPTTATPTPTATAARTTGNVTIHSNPLGATVFLDGLYRGVTPLELSGIPAGFHSVKMTMEGRYDYDGSVFVVVGETVTAFGSLPKQEGHAINEGTQVPPAATPVGSGSDNPLSSPVVIGGAITAGIGALVTIYTQKMKKP